MRIDECRKREIELINRFTEEVDNYFLFQEEVTRKHVTDEHRNAMPSDEEWAKEIHEEDEQQWHLERKFAKTVDEFIENRALIDDWKGDIKEYADSVGKRLKITGPLQVIHDKRKNEYYDWLKEQNDLEKKMNIPSYCMFDRNMPCLMYNCQDCCYGYKWERRCLEMVGYFRQNLEKEIRPDENVFRLPGAFGGGDKEHPHWLHEHAMDHGRYVESADPYCKPMWRNVAIGEPYSIDMSTMEDLIQWCKDHKVVFTITGYSRHNPGNCFRITYDNKKDQKDQKDQK